MTTGASTDKEFAARSESGTLLLACVSSLALIAARWESAASVRWLLIPAGLFLTVPWFVWFGLRHAKAARRRLDAALPLVIAGWLVLPLATETVLRQAAIGSAPEIIMLACLQNAALMAAAYSHRRRCRHAACLLSGFLTLFAVVIGSSPAVFALSGLYGLMMLWWLMARYWERVRFTRTATRSDLCLPLRGSVLGAVLAVGLLLAVIFGSTGASTHALQGFMPSSGGDRVTDPFARSGVGDGDALVAAREQAMSFGPVESELFLDSEMPSLYDMFDDTYGEPSKDRKQQLSIGLAFQEREETKQRVAQTTRSGREFSAVRRRAAQPQKPLDDRRAPAMLYVVGRVPLHLTLQRYDTFDGRRWSHSRTVVPRPPIELEREGTADKPWMRIDRWKSSSVHRGVERHALKIINLKTNRVPSPPQLSAVHIDLVNRTDFFGWTGDGVLEMPRREHIPQLTIFHLRSQGIDLTELRAGDFTRRLPGPREPAIQPPRSATEVQAQVVAENLRLPGPGPHERLAEEWVAGVPRGWRQVEAVVDRLRNDFDHDRSVVAPPDCPDVVAHFLKTRRGPDYLFATTAAVMLRSLGYPARLAAGFYARPERYEPRAGQTAVLAEDVHVWTEVCVDGRTWIPIEPTPGYEPPPEMLSFTERLARWGRQLIAWLGAHGLPLSLGGLLAVVLLLHRVACCDLVARVVCWLAGWGSARRRVLWTVRLLETRAWLAGSARPPQAPLSAWYGHLAAACPPSAAEALRATLGTAERLLYGSETRPPLELSDADTTQACSIVARQVGLSCFRGTFGSKPTAPAATGKFRVAGNPAAATSARTMPLPATPPLSLLPSLLLSIGLFLMLSASAARPAWACPFCTALSNTLSDDLKDAAAGVLAEQTGVEQPGTEGLLPLHRFRLVEVLKGPPRAANGATLRGYSNLELEPGRLCLLLAYDESAEEWMPSAPLTPAAVEYLRALPRLPKTGAERLVHFLPYLDHPDRLLADDAYNEFARASLTDVEKLADRLDRARVLAQLRDAETPLHRRRLYWTLLSICGRPEDAAVVDELVSRRLREEGFDPGLDAALACYVTLGGEPALRDVEDRYLRNAQAEYSDTYAAIHAIRVHGTEWTKIPQERLAAALRQVLSRPALADLVIADLARWEDWSVIDRLYELFVTADEQSRFVKEPVVNYLRVCPLPEAAEALRRLRERDPETVLRAETLSLFRGLGAPADSGTDAGDVAEDDSPAPAPPATAERDVTESSPPEDISADAVRPRVPAAAWWLTAGAVATGLLLAVGKFHSSRRRRLRKQARGPTTGETEP